MIKPILNVDKLKRVVKSRIKKRVKLLNKYGVVNTHNLDVQFLTDIYSGLLKMKLLAKGIITFGHPIIENYSSKLHNLLNLIPFDFDPYSDAIKEVDDGDRVIIEVDDELLLKELNYGLKLINMKYGKEVKYYTTFPILMLQSCGGNINDIIGFSIYHMLKQSVKSEEACGWMGIEIKNIARHLTRIESRREGELPLIIGANECILGLIPLIEANLVTLFIDELGWVRFKLMKNDVANRIYDELIVYSYGALTYVIKPIFKNFWKQLLNYENIMDYISNWTSAFLYPVKVRDDRLINEFKTILNMMSREEVDQLLSGDLNREERIRVIREVIPKYIDEYARRKYMNYLRVKEEVDKEVFENRRRDVTGREKKMILLSIAQHYLYIKDLYSGNFEYDFWPLIDIEIHNLLNYLIRLNWKFNFKDVCRLAIRILDSRVGYQELYEGVDKALFVRENWIDYLNIDRLKQEAIEYLEKYKVWKEEGLINRAREKIRDAIRLINLIIDRGRREGYDMKEEYDERLFLTDQLSNLEEIRRRKRIL